MNEKNSQQQHRFSRSTEIVLRQGGWSPGRCVPLKCSEEEAVHLHYAARAVLHEFGGLSLQTFADRNQVTFFGYTASLEIYAGGLEGVSEINACEQCRKLWLCDIGHIGCGSGILVIDSHGRVYVMSDKLMPLALTFDQAIESELSGKYASVEELILCGMTYVNDIWCHTH